MDLAQLRSFLVATQTQVAEALDLDNDSPTRQKFLARLQGEITKRGVIDVLRHGVKHGPHHDRSFLSARRRPATRRPPSGSPGTALPSPGSSATAGMRPSSPSTWLCSSTGLPVATFELKNSLTKQTVEDAVEQYKRDRDPRELLFEFGRCVVHFAVDDQRGAVVHPPQGQGLMVPAVQPGLERRRGQPAQPRRAQDRLPLEARSSRRRADRHPRELRPDRRREGPTRPARRSASRFSRATTSSMSCGKLLADVARNGAGKRYLIQHSAGSGKSNSIAWLAHQLIGLKQDGKQVFDSIIVVTDRRILDDRSATRSSSSRRSARRSATPSTPATCASSSKPARRSSSPPFRSSRSSSTRSATSIADGRSPSSSTRRIPARAARPPAAHERSAVGRRREEDDETIEDTINRDHGSRARC